MTQQPLWTPSAEQVAATNMAAFMRRAGADSYEALWQWSVERPEAFWPLVWDFCGAVGERGDAVLERGDRMPGAIWFPQAKLNYAENLLRQRDDSDALVFWGEGKVRRRLSRAQLYAEVSRFQQALKAAGVGEGDRVAGYLPNMPETIVAMLATTALGAVWSSASPDFGVQGVVDRFGQIEAAGVNGLADDDAVDVVMLARLQLLDVGNAGHAAAGDHLEAGHVAQPRGQLQIDA